MTQLSNRHSGALLNSFLTSLPLPQCTMCRRLIVSTGLNLSLLFLAHHAGYSVVNHHQT